MKVSPNWFSTPLPAGGGVAAVMNAPATPRGAGVTCTPA